MKMKCIRTSTALKPERGGWKLIPEADSHDGRFYQITTTTTTRHNKSFNRFVYTKRVRDKQ